MKPPPTKDAAVKFISKKTHTVTTLRKVKVRVRGANGPGLCQATKAQRGSADSRESDYKSADAQRSTQADIRGDPARYYLKGFIGIALIWDTSDTEEELRGSCFWASCSHREKENKVHTAGERQS